MPPNATRKVLSIADLANLGPKQREAQRAMYSRPNAHVLMGGSGYGGKSHALRALAVDFAIWLWLNGHYRVPLMLATSTYPALQDRHIQRMGSEWGDFGEVVGSQKSGLAFQFKDRKIGPISLRNLDKPGKRKGAEFGGLFIDELTELTQHTYGEISYTARKPGIPVHPIVSATNPDGPGHAWVKKIWRPHKATTSSGLLSYVQDEHWPESADMPPRANPHDYIYVPFLPTDNPHFTEELWATMTANLDPRIREARRYGKWDHPEGAVFGYLSEEVHRFSAKMMFSYGIPVDWEIRIGVDYGIRDPFCALWTAIDRQNRRAYTYREIYKAGITPDEQARLIALATTDQERRQLKSIWFDPSMFNKLPNHTGELSNSVAEIYAAEWSGLPQDKKLPVPRHGFNRSRVQALGFLHRLLGREGDSWQWFISSECEHLWGELTAAVYPGERHKSPVLNEDLDPVCSDHAITASYYHLFNLVYREPAKDSMDHSPVPPNRVLSGVRLTR